MSRPARAHRWCDDSSHTVGIAISTDGHAVSVVVSPDVALALQPQRVENAHRVQPPGPARARESNNNDIYYSRRTERDTWRLALCVFLCVACSSQLDFSADLHASCCFGLRRDWTTSKFIGWNQLGPVLLWGTCRQVRMSHMSHIGPKPSVSAPLPSLLFVVCRPHTVFVSHARRSYLSAEVSASQASERVCASMFLCRVYCYVASPAR